MAFPHQNSLWEILVNHQQLLLVIIIVSIVLYRHHLSHFFMKCPTFCLFKISAPSHILVCALIYLPYLPVNLRHIFHQIPHIQLVPMCSNLHCCTYNNFSHKILHRIFHALFYRFLQNLLRIGSNALQWRIWPLHKPTVWQRSFITSQYSPSLSDIHLRSQYRVICNKVSSPILSLS